MKLTALIIACGTIAGAMVIQVCVLLFVKEESVSRVICGVHSLVLVT
jgi:hypothetical protein